MLVFTRVLLHVVKETAALQVFKLAFLLRIRTALFGDLTLIDVLVAVLDAAVSQVVCCASTVFIHQLIELIAELLPVSLLVLLVLNIVVFESDLAQQLVVLVALDRLVLPTCRQRCACQ